MSTDDRLPAMPAGLAPEDAVLAGDEQGQRWIHRDDVEASIANPAGRYDPSRDDEERE